MTSLNIIHVPVTPQWGGAEAALPAAPKRTRTNSKREQARII